MIKRLIIAITGASGTIYGVRALEMLKETNIETHLIMSDSAKITMSSETNYDYSYIESLSDVVHSPKNIGATIASGSFKTLGMLIAPCSINSMSQIAHGTTSNLISRAADVVLKERRKLVLALRETPFHAGHIKSMAQVTENGGIIMPPVPAFYSLPKTIDEMVNHSVARMLDLFDIETENIKRWEGLGK
ncbi:MAG: UbiX family flavin prenyltransferase [Burkholderiales bacterium]|nr:UbiX family flavin prenyltransferase [Burkholderiales bacterium]